MALLLLHALVSRTGILSDPYLRGWVVVMEPGDASPVQGSDGALLYRFSLRDEAFFYQKFSGFTAFVRQGGLLIFLLEALSGLLILTMAYQLMRLFRNLDRGRVFDRENVTRVRIVALAIGAWPLVRYAAESLLFRQLVAAEYFPGLHIVPSHQVEVGLGMLAVALIALALVEVFRTGLRLQREQDLTV